MIEAVAERVRLVTPTETNLRASDGNRLPVTRAVTHLLATSAVIRLGAAMDEMFPRAIVTGTSIAVVGGSRLLTWDPTVLGMCQTNMGRIGVGMLPMTSGTIVAGTHRTTSGAIVVEMQLAISDATATGTQLATTGEIEVGTILTTIDVIGMHVTAKAATLAGMPRAVTAAATHRRGVHPVIMTETHLIEDLTNLVFL